MFCKSNLSVQSTGKWLVARKQPVGIFLVIKDIVDGTDFESMKGNTGYELKYVLHSLKKSIISSCALT